MKTYPAKNPAMPVQVFLIARMGKRIGDQKKQHYPEQQQRQIFIALSCGHTANS